MTFGDVNETVTAKDVINLRSTPYTGDEGNVVGQLKTERRWSVPAETIPPAGPDWNTMGRRYMR